MTMVKVDQKLRIRLPQNARKALRIKSRQTLNVEVKEGTLVISRPSSRRSLEMDPALRDMIERPLHSKIKITTELLERLGEEQMMGL